MSNSAVPQPLNYTGVIITHRHDERFVAAVQSLPRPKQIIIVNNHPEPLPKLPKSLPIIIVNHTAPITDFAVVRNQILTEVKTKWVFFLDSDEQVSPTLAKRFPQLLKNENIQGYAIKRLDFFQQQPLHHGEVGHVFLLRLAQTRSLSFIRPVHEVGQVIGQTTKIIQPIYHYSHQNISSFLTKINLYSTLIANQSSVPPKIIIFMQASCYPVAKFYWNYIVKLGFLDGFPGLIYASLMSWHSLLVRVKQYERHQPT